MNKPKQSTQSAIKIIYCVECDYLPLATKLAAAIKARFNLSATLEAGHDGIYAVSLNDHTLYSNLDYGGVLPSNDQIFEALEAHLPRPGRSQSRKLKVYHPMGFPPAIEPLRMAPRLDTLDGKMVYLVDTRFDDGDRLLLQMERWFAEHLPNTETKFVRKSGVYTEDDPALFQEIASQGDAMIMAVGH